jgi:hypothetical protein
VLNFVDLEPANKKTEPSPYCTFLQLHAGWFSLNSPFAARRSESVERQIVGNPFKRVAE